MLDKQLHKYAALLEQGTYTEIKHVPMFDNKYKNRLQFLNNGHKLKQILFLCLTNNYKK